MPSALNVEKQANVAVVWMLFHARESQFNFLELARNFVNEVYVTFKMRQHSNKCKFARIITEKSVGKRQLAE